MKFPRSRQFPEPDVDFYIVVCKDRSGEIVGWQDALHITRKDALAERRKLPGLRESVIRVEVWTKP